MSKKKALVFAVSIFLLIVVFAGIAVVITSTTTATTTADGGKKGGKAALTGGKEAAEVLIDQTVSRDKIEEEVGEWNDFELDGNGCERGVFAGRFFYDDFTIYSRTYDKGETFHVMSINE